MGVTTEVIVEFLNNYTGRKFKWGVFDCATFFSDTLQLMTGFDYSPIILGKWKSRRGAMKFFTKLDFLKFIECELHYEEVNLSSAVTGDLCVIQDSGMHTVGIIYGTNVAVVKEEAGMDYLQLTEVSDNILKIVRVQ